MKPATVVPVYPTLASLSAPPVARRKRLNAQWRTWFPFSCGSGLWSFSGRVALYHGLPSLELPVGSTILVPSYHQGVEIDTLLAAGYRLRYYRLDESLAIDLRDVERRLDATVSALYVTHYFGFPQPIAAVRGFCEAHGLRLIEDCALSLFSRHDDGTWLGSHGDLALFSVYKTLALPHGGFAVTKRALPATTLRPVPLASTLVQTIDLVQQTLRATGWAGFASVSDNGSGPMRRTGRMSGTAPRQAPSEVSLIPVARSGPKCSSCGCRKRTSGFRFGTSS